jgi:D-alanyl-D-alanine carboxypeptidase
MNSKTRDILTVVANSVFAGMFALLSWVIMPVAEVEDENPSPDSSAGLSDSSQSGQSDGGWAYYLIDGDHPLPENFVPTVAIMTGNVPVDRRMAQAAERMIVAAANDGVTLLPVSGYRSYAKQRENYDAYVDKYMDEGMEESAARAYADTQIAQPRESEHNAGLAIDFATPDWYQTHDELNETFAGTNAFGWLDQNAYKFGFILSYHKGKEPVQNGIAYEPWHWRYIGEKAEDVWLTGVTLPEYIEFYG